MSALIVDNIPSNFKLQPRNGIYIARWRGEEDDCFLLNLLPVLELLVNKSVPEVGVGLEQISKYMKNQLQKGQKVDL
jgi:CTD small phosphatase-like protein 2